MKTDPELQGFVNGLVRSGKFPTVDDAVAEAVRRLKERQARIERLRHEVQIGIDELDRGEREPLDIDAVEAELVRKYSSR